MKYIVNRKLAVILFCCTISLFLLLLSYKMVLVFSGLTPAQENVFGFLEEKQELPPGYTEAEISHLEDVKRVIKASDYIFYLLLLSITVMLTYYHKDRPFTIKLLRYAGISSVMVTASILLLSLLLFNAVFTLFHQLFFPLGNWTFPAGSLLIQTFPLQFFISISRNIFLVALFLGILFILPGYYLNYVLRHRN